jgi:hypothetical protein
MPQLRVLKPKNFEEYVRFVGELNVTNDGRSWYRGASDSSHKLIPGLYRHHATREPLEWSKIEKQMMLSFAQKSMPFVDRAITMQEKINDSDWSLLFFMQHYKIPTRLLDWSESPFAALFFATSGTFEPSSKTASGHMEFPHDAVVWILNPVKWNSTAWNHLSWNGGIAYTNEDNLNSYRPPFAGRDVRELPIAMHGSHNSPRIVAQRGAFTIFGTSAIPMEQHFTTNRKFSDELVKVIIEKKRIPEFRKALYSYGVTESVIYPDLEGLAHEIKRDFGFEE